MEHSAAEEPDIFLRALVETKNRVKRELMDIHQVDRNMTVLDVKAPYQLKVIICQYGVQNSFPPPPSSETNQLL